MKLSVIFLTEYLNYASYNSSKHLSSSIIFPIRLRVPDNFIMDVNLTRGNYQSVIISLDNKYIIKNQSFLLCKCFDYISNFNFNFKIFIYIVMIPYILIYCQSFL